MLTPSGYRVLLAEGGQAGLALAFEHRPDLAIVDLMMPDMSGFEVVAALGDDPRTAAVPVLVLTAADLSAAERDQLKRRARALAQKGTITRADLMAAVRQAVGDLPHRSRAAGPTVLIVDDHDLNRELARAIVERLGFRALCAEDGAAGVEAARRERPALILLDLAMPGMDGYAAARQLRGAPETSAIPLVALTALAMRGDEERAYASGIDAYLTKPIDGPALENVLHHFAGGRLGAPWRRPPGVISSSVRPPPARDPT